MTTGTLTIATDAVSTITLDNETVFSTMSTNSSDVNSFMATSESFLTENLTTAGMLETTTQGDRRTFRFEDYTQRAIIGTIVCLVAVVGFVGNVMVILAVILSRKLQTRTNVFVVNLAVADLVTCFSAPFTVVALLSKVGWPMPEIVCSIMAAIGLGSIACSIMTLAAISINRFVLITKTTATYRTIYTPKKIAAMVAFTWVYPALVCSISPIFGVGKWGYSDKYKTCTQDTSHETSDFFSLVGSALIYPIPLIVLFVCYFKIYRHITGHMKKMMGKGKGVEMTDTSNSSNVASTTKLHKNPPASFSKRQVEITKNLFYVVCAFVACLAPFAIALMIPPSDPVIPWTGMIIIFNSGINPIIYGAKHPHFKEVFRHMLRCQYHMIPEPSGCLRKIRSR
ncbi:alpha-1B adrenergic receptor-like [Patiria miniata]|uniref:G-protein coupled receptors family 1 profile domain-containing protein n=1 Tax=Patiria miniata TaxID=46514 RepID=A0A914BDR7_PATMI|nr:alpha-1B adrenergic receptor-like [Patiria miniata]